MFEENDQQKTPPMPQGVSGMHTNEPEDMFKETDTPGPAGSALQAGLLRPAAPLPHQDASVDGRTARHEEDEMEIKPPILSKGKLVFLLILAVVVLVAGVLVFLFRFTGSPAPRPAAESGSESGAEQAPPTESEESPAFDETDIVPVIVPETPGAPADTDADGLTDEEEVRLGTDPQSADTDADGLTDKEEVLLWRTDPLNKDTDGDTYLDGEEVSNNYSPLGPGRLFE